MRSIGTSMATLEFGCATRDVTPDRPVWMAGYAARTGKSVGAVDPITVGAAAIRGTPDTLLILTADVVGIRTREVARIRTAVAEATGIPAHQVVIACSHTHFGPAISVTSLHGTSAGLVTPDDWYVDSFVDRISECAAEAVSKLQPATVETARFSAPAVMFNRRTIRADGSVETNFRYPAQAANYRFSPVDDQLVCLRFRSGDGAKLGYLLNLGCHPVTGGADRERDYRKLSADWVHHLRAGLAGDAGCPILFTLGAAGDVVPMRRYGDSREHIGQVLAGTVILGEPRFAADADPTVRSSAAQLAVKTIVQLDPAATQREADAAMERLRALESKGTATDSAEWRDAFQPFGQSLTRLLSTTLYPENRFDIPLQFARIGSTRFAALPFEVLAEFSRNLKQEMPDGVVLSCSGGYEGYLPFQHEYDRGGYEASEWSTHFEVGTAEKLYDLCVTGLQRL